MTSKPGTLNLDTAEPEPDPDPLLPRLDLELGANVNGLSGFDMWREVLSGMYEILPPADGVLSEPFRVKTTSWHLGELVAIQIAFSAREQARTPRKIRADQLDHYLLLFQTSGELHVEAEGRQIVVRPGQALVSDMARPERLSSTAGSNIVLAIPREVLDEALPSPVPLHGLVLEGSTARLLANLLRTLVEEADELRRSSALGVSRSAVQLVSAALAPSAQTLHAARPAIEVNLMRQICRYIDLHLTDTTLSPPAICSEFRVSRPTLYRMFEPLGGVVSYIKERRLTRIHGLLESASGARMHLGRLAEEYAFADAGHFSRSFRKMFGYSPSEVASGVPNAALDSSIAAVGPRRSLDFWLKSLAR